VRRRCKRVCKAFLRFAPLLSTVRKARMSLSH
jgi:hypothetical protein